MTDIGGDCLRCGQCEGYGCNCTTEEQQSAYIDHLIAAKDAQDAKIKALVEALEPFASIGIGTNPDYQPMIRMDRGAILKARAALAAAKETT